MYKKTAPERTAQLKLEFRLSIGYISQNIAIGLQPRTILEVRASRSLNLHLKVSK